MARTETGPIKAASTAEDRQDSLPAGRVLLTLMEHGEGPSIEIAWPDDRSAWAPLYRRLTGCHGVTTVLLAGDGRVFDQGGTPGQGRRLDRDRWSTFIRHPKGDLVHQEKRRIQAIRHRHGLIEARPVRLFPRHVDAAFLGQLAATLGGSYRDAEVIRATYGLDGATLVVGDITVDGRPIKSDMRLASRKSGCGR
ncbi:MAG: hypothetical protein ACPGOV_06615 [Magnetovibrionaceae bacterium]